MHILTKRKKFNVLEDDTKVILTVSLHREVSLNMKQNENIVINNLNSPPNQPLAQQPWNA